MKRSVIKNIIRNTIQEVYSEKQRKWACVQAGLPAHKRQKSLSKKEAEEMCRDTKISKKSVKEDVNMAADITPQLTSYRDEETGKAVSSNLMLDTLDEKLNANTLMLETILAKVSNLEENLGRRWT